MKDTERTGPKPMRADLMAVRAQYRAWLLRDGADEQTLDHLIRLEVAMALDDLDTALDSLESAIAKAKA